MAKEPDHPSRCGVFVANRCFEIYTLLSDAYWHHVRYSDNPADVISRGIEPRKLASYSLWWKGPDWPSDNHEPLSKSHYELNIAVNNFIFKPSHSPIANKASRHSVKNTPEMWKLINEYSLLNKLLRMASYCFRFIFRICSKTSLS